jgi:hypothetical protein
MENPYSQPAMFLRWQLVDVITIYSDIYSSQNQLTSSKPIASVLMAESPSLVAGPYNTYTSAPLLTLINCGSHQAVGGFAADMDFSGGDYYGPVSQAIDTALIPAPVPPQAVYQTTRYGSTSPTSSTSFSYTLQSLAAAAAYNVTLHFVDFIATTSGLRQFNVSINGLQVLTNFDIIAETGAQFKAIAKSFTTMANAQGQIIIQFDAIQNSYTPIVNAIVVGPTLTPVTEARRQTQQPAIMPTPQ